jgi:hypothetical protein
MTLEERFFRLLELSPGPVLELGTRRWKADCPDTWRDRVNAVAGCAHVGVDVLPGDDVDMVADAHHLAAAWFDRPDPARPAGFVCRATLEHLRRPWVAAHQSFPVHGYPSDFFRFTREALGEVFHPDHGWRVVDSEYRHPCRVVPQSNAFAHAKDWNFEAEAWLCVAALVERL